MAQTPMVTQVKSEQKFYNAQVHGVPKMTRLVFCQNFIKSAPNLIIFGTQIAKTIEIC